MGNANLLLSAIEQRHLWAYFHKGWLLEIRRLLRPQIPAAYAVFIQSETVLLSPDWQEFPTRTMPDLAVARPVAETANHPPQSSAVVVDDWGGLFAVSSIGRGTARSGIVRVGKSCQSGDSRTAS